MPLGMHAQLLRSRAVPPAADRSHSYSATTQALPEARFDFDTGITVSNGGLNAPFDDMANTSPSCSATPARRHTTWC